MNQRFYLWGLCLLYGCGTVPEAVLWESTDFWPRHTIDASSMGADGVKLSDINQDGLPDIATGWEEGGIVRVYVHPGYAKAKEAWPAVTVGEAAKVEDAVFFDVDSDGVMDVVSATEGDEKALYVHRAPLDPSSYLTSSEWQRVPLEGTEGRMQWMYAMSFDVDGDGRLDLVAAGKNEAARIGWLSVAGGSWVWRELASVAWVMSVFPFDATGDGIEDIVYTDRKGGERGVYVLPKKMENGQTFIGPALYIAGDAFEVMFMDHGNLLGDERHELAVATMHAGVLILARNGADAWSQDIVPFPDGVGTGKGVGVGDLDRDGAAELVLTSENASGLRGVYYLKRYGKRWRAFDIGGLEGTKFDRIELVDMDGDGDLDVLTCEETENLGVIWYENPLGRSEP